jgi:hypothetical protein
MSGGGVGFMSVMNDHDLPPARVATLPDDPALEHDLADARRAALECDAAPDDPLGLYTLEVERDEALDDLAAHLPAGASLRLARHAIHQRVLGCWERVDGWVASVTTADGRFTLSRQGSRPLAAAELLLNAWRAHGPATTDNATGIEPAAVPTTALPAPADGPRAA